MISCTRRIQFCAGHRVFGHESKCANMHGHNYVAFFHARKDPSAVVAVGENDETDSIGRVIDFAVLKERIGGWIDTHWDHKFIVNMDDKPCMAAFDAFGFAGDSDNGASHWIAPFNPTAEGMAEYLLNTVCPQVLADADVEVFKVVLWETENCFAEAAL